MPVVNGQNIFRQRPRVDVIPSDSTNNKLDSSHNAGAFWRCPKLESSFGMYLYPTRESSEFVNPHLSMNLFHSPFQDQIVVKNDSVSLYQ